ncbi:phosphosulfolactate synthase [Paenibacillus macerans]|uniref:phosphosulfolactate synthase n=1 Tax=Paenibacillus TaxID=44249 RepID=UPI00097B3E48|nr:phosphosulfolactate synthase [Paenibacillus macerans]MBS5910473.1 phosphosulfolactate synthase [Paenibacillus macerans]MEC0138683.1 phosphosulfolactate synthase [Paenibacillus macerans]OMG51167.1 phosphosulfolactate synthase [Paenibacillus macerans]GBK61556.1 phosphosulfolactate synthase [Paenibacillus macerans]GBK67859.1 phosphosulfolactate synthase [Paenibacillus macerans]
MNSTLRAVWPPELSDPSGLRRQAPGEGNRQPLEALSRGLTMIIDKGLGRNAFADLIELGSPYVDCVKFGFGTSPLYSTELLLYKINLAKRHGLMVMPGGTLLETAVQQDAVPAFFDAVCSLGFNGIEVSDGTIELPRKKRTELIQEGKKHGLKVVTEFGKKLSGSLIDATHLAETQEADLEAGAELMTVEARESGCGVGIFDEKGDCRMEIVDNILEFVPDSRRLMWEAPLKHQQVLLLRKFGSDVHLGNIPPADILSLETMRRGLRQDTFEFGIKQTEAKECFYVI